MKIKKFSIYALISGAVILSATYFALFNGAIQTSIVNSTIKKSFPNSSIKSVKITPTSAKISGIDLKNITDGNDFFAEELEADISLFDLIFKDINIENLKLKNAVLTCKTPQAKTQISASQGSDKIENLQSKTTASQTEIKTDLSQNSKTQKPAPINWNLDIKNASLDFLAILPDGSKINTKLNIDTFKSQKLIELKALDAELKCDFEITGKAKDSLTLKASLADDKNGYNLKTILEKADKKLVQILAKIDSDYKNIDGKIQLRADSNDFSNILKNTPYFDANILCDVRLSSDLADAGINGSFRLDAKDLKKISPTLEPISSIALSGEISANKRGNEFSLANASALASVNGSQIFTLKNANSFKFDLKRIGEIPDGNLVVFDLINIPSSLINPFLKNAHFEASKISAQFLLSKSADKFELKTSKALEISNSSFSLSNGEVFENLDATFTMLANANTKSAAGNLNLTLKQNGKNEILNTNLKLKSFEFETQSLAAELVVTGSPKAILPQKFSKNLNGNLNALFDISKESNIAKLKTAKLELTNSKSDSSENIFELNSAREIVFDLAQNKLLSKDLEISANAKNFPFEIVAPYSAGFDAKTLNLNAKANSSDGMNFKILANLAANNCAYAKDGKTLISNLDAEIAIKADVAQNSAVIEVENLNISEKNVHVLKASAKADVDFKGVDLLKSATLKFSASLPKILAQPCLESFNNTASGMLEADASFKENRAIANLNLHNLSARGGSETLAKFEVTADAKFEKFVPQTLETLIKAKSSKGESEIKLNTKFADIIDALISAKSIYVDDFEILYQSFTKPKTTQVAQKTVLEGENANAKKTIIRPKEASQKTEVKIAEVSTKSKVDTKAFWDFSKSLTLNTKVEKIVYKSQTAVENLDFKFLLNPNELSLPTLTAKTYGANLKANCDLKFKQNTGYELINSQAEVSGLEVANFQEPNSAGDVFIKGVFNANIALNCNAPNLAEFANNMQANAALTSDSGTITLLDKSSIAGVATGVGGLALKITSNILGDKVKELPAISEIFGLFQKLDYTKINLKAVRGKDLDIVISDCVVEASDFLIKADGKIDCEDGTDFMQSKIDIPVKVYAKNGNIAELLKKCGVATDVSSLQGYANGPEFQIYGTLSAPENNLKQVILDTAKNALNRNDSDTTKAIGTGIDALGGLLNKFKKR